jgi:hypothetical protein
MHHFSDSWEAGQGRKYRFLFALVVRSAFRYKPPSLLSGKIVF